MNLIQKPKNPEEYKSWLRQKFGVFVDNRTKTHYDHVSISLKDQIEKSAIWLAILENLSNYNDEYFKNHNSNLFIVQKYKPEIVLKSYDSFIEKTYRKNVLQNKDWPDPPRWGNPETQEWIIPKNWFHAINDIARTTIEVKYLDGVEFIVKKIDNLCQQKGITPLMSCEAKEEGYYAAHIYLKLNYDIPNLQWKTKSTEVYFEIQIMTELQSLIKSLLHKYYEEKRVKDVEDLRKRKKNWQWDYQCDEFAANYLGHILHYVEGMIVKIRDKQE
jgi:ppGpp synthetase/RelA/SpoT-type nucleotidyltranferase